MNEKVEGLLGVPLKELAPMCQDIEVLAEVIQIAFNKGYQAGQKQTHANLNQAFKGYTAEVIKN